MLQTTSISVSSGQQTTTACDTGVNQVVGFIFPATITSTTADLLVSMDDVSYVNMTDKDGALIQLTNIAGNRHMSLPPEVSYATPRFLKLQLGTAEGGDRVIEVVVREI